ncbi:MAG: hypothetical protein QM715_15265 [Nibricoccus sp.]
MDLLELQRLIKNWDLTQGPDLEPGLASQYQAIYDRLQWFSDNDWRNYLPTKNPAFNADYMVRLAKWMGNVKTDEERQLLLKYARRITYFSQDDMEALYQTAFTGPITQWIIEKEKLSLLDPKFQIRLQEELHTLTWYCPVTDSMKIADFLHINLITENYRPCFRDHYHFKSPEEVDGTIAKFKKYMSKPNSSAGAPSLKRLVLLDDFVGSGTQVTGPIKWAAQNLNVPILFIPLVICAPGLSKINDLRKDLPNLDVSPIIVLSEENLLGPKRRGKEGIEIAAEIEKLANSTFGLVAGSTHTDKNTSPYTAFGYQETGATYVSHSNTPNNTLPLVHHKSVTGNWQPLFPRSKRA